MKAFRWSRWFFVAFLLSLSFLVAVLVSFSFFAGREFESRRWSEEIMSFYDASLMAAYKKGLIEGRADCGKGRL